MMSGRANYSLVLSIWLMIVATSGPTVAERWSRQVSSSDWIPLTNPRSHQEPSSSLAGGQNLPQLPQSHQPLLPNSLPPELRQEYQQQLLKLQKTQESIQRLLLLQQELKQQQQLLQSQGLLPNGMAEREENKQTHQQGSVDNPPTLPDLSGDVLVPPPELASEDGLPIYSSQNFREPQTETMGQQQQQQQQYEDYSDRQNEDYRNGERTRQSQKNKEQYVSEVPSGSANNDEAPSDGEEEIQLVYVPAEVLAQRLQSKNQQRGRKPHVVQNTRLQHHHQQQHHSQRPFANQRGQSPPESTANENDEYPTTVSPQDDAYAREFLQQLQREHEGTDRLLKEARQKELDRLREERKEIQRQAKLRQASVEREQEIQRQREAEKERKKLARLEEAAKQRELERIREAREKHRREELERAAQARANEEKRKQEEARRAEIERLAVLERQKKADLEKAAKAQLEKAQKDREERGRETGRTTLRHNEATRQRLSESNASPQAQPLIRSQHQQQQHQTHGTKHNRPGRTRNKPRQRQHNVHNHNANGFDLINQEATTMTPLSPNQPPLAVYMVNLSGNNRVPVVSDVLKTLKDAKTIDVLDNVGQDVPRVFVGPSDLEVPLDYAKFDLPYLSSIDNNRVERRVDKLPFFVAPLSFNPPPGYSKIPFPAPHIGSVVVNTLDTNVSPTQLDDSFDNAGQSNFNHRVEPNSYADGPNAGISYSTGYDSQTTPGYAKYRQDEPTSTPQYQFVPPYPSLEASGPGTGYVFRQQSNGQQPGSLGSLEQTQSGPAFQEQSQVQAAFRDQVRAPQPNQVSQYSDESFGPTTPTYRRPNGVTSFTYEDGAQSVSSTPVYQENYSQIRGDSNTQQGVAPLTLANHDLPEHREVVHRYQEQSHRGQEYPTGQIDSGVNSYDDAVRGPAQYNLPAELPPIMPQLPGLVNSLLDEGAQAALVNRQPPVPTTSTTTTTTTEAPTTTQRSRGRYRGRATRPSTVTTTTTTTPNPPARSRDTDRTRRPGTRSRSRFTTTTEQYRDTYEPTRSNTSPTTQRYNAQESYRRPTPVKTQKIKSRDSEVTRQSSRNHLPNLPSQEADDRDRNPISDSNVRIPQPSEETSNGPAYSQYNFASSAAGFENYPGQSGLETGRFVEGEQAEYSKNADYAQAQSSTSGNPRDQDDPIAQQYQGQFSSGDFRQPSLENAPVNGFNYQITNERFKATTNAPPTSRDYGFHQNTQENVQDVEDSAISSDASPSLPINDYQPHGSYGKSQNGGIVYADNLTGSQPQFPITDDKTSNWGANDGPVYDPYSSDNLDNPRTTGSAPQRDTPEITTKTTTTTSTTTQATPVVIRQRVRGRLGVRNRPDSQVQTRPRGSQDEYVRFSAVNNQETTTTERPTTRHREITRTRPKNRHQYHGTVQVQTEGNDYVRIQAPIRTYQKTIVTSPSTTQRTTTSPVPMTTTVRYEEPSNDELEYGFIRPPNFGPVQPVDNGQQDSYRPGVYQPQPTSIVPTDETVDEQSSSHTQVSRNPPKYQSTNRRLSTKPVTMTTPLASDLSPYTENPRIRVDEPKNNRLCVRGRRPGRRRTTTTTKTTTTEYVLEESNDLPVGENYPRRLPIKELSNDRQGLYEEKLDDLSLASGVTENPIQQRNADISYASQDFLPNFGTEPAGLDNPERDQTQLASQPPRSYGQNFGSRSRTHSTHRTNKDRDIYGAESQWSTKLTSNSFQPSPTANRLSQDDEKSARYFDSRSNEYSENRESADAPEIITAAPGGSYVTVLVSSDKDDEKSSSVDTTEAPSMEGTNYGMKTSVDGRSNVENTTASFVNHDTISSTTSTVTDSPAISSGNNGTENSSDSVANNVPKRRAGMRRRRVRVRVRPVPTDDFVTAESQHINSAVNSLVQDRLKYERFNDPSKPIPFTLQSSTLSEQYAPPKPEVPERTMFDDFFDEMFKTENNSTEPPTSITPSTVDTTTTTTTTTTTLKNMELNVNEESQEISTTMENVETTTEILKNNSGKKNDVNSNDDEKMDSSTDMDDLGGQSWDSTKQFIDSIAMQSGEYLSAKNYPENVVLDDNNPSDGGNELSVNDEKFNVDVNSNDSNANEENYPKNHRSEWSEVRYPNDRGLFNYHRQLNLTDVRNRLPGVVAKSDGDGNVETLSDYVKAIFDTMKNVDDENSQNTNFSTSEPNNSNVKNLKSSTNVSTIVDENSEIDSTTESNIRDYSTNSELSTENFDNTEQTTKYDSTDFEKIGTFEDFLESERSDEFSGNTEGSRVSENFEKSSGREIGETTERSEISSDVESTTNISTEENPSSSSASRSSENSKDVPIERSENSTVSGNDDASTSTTENSPIAMTSSKLSGVVRTSTTTKVSHMTEICYRGRCVMTKPKKEFYAR